MGVPAFYRWLSEKYPKIIQDVVEDRVHLAPNTTNTRLPFDHTRPNPSNLECDNLYIDMNGIIHPCSHPEDGPQPKTEEEMYENVCRYVDRLFRAVRPRRLLYLAIDGVAPRAKMNQQRSRRFRGAQEVRENLETKREAKENLRAAGHCLDDEEEEGKEVWDSNVITPGTPFMLRLSEFVRFYIRKRISTDAQWKKIAVVFSDASIPGEGEHKIMTHIRKQRAQPTYIPNLVHILHGLDADLIMLALATHELNFYILREEVLFGWRSAEEAERRKASNGTGDLQKQLDEAAGAEAMCLPENKCKPLQRLSIPVLREYLAFEFQELQYVPFPEPSFERLIDDVVFLCFFVGNDFLPHLPSMDIRDGALDFLFNVYKRILPTLGGYITTDTGGVNLSHVDVILAEVGGIEDYIFNLKHQNEQANKRKREEMMERKKNLTRDGKAMRADMVMGNAVDAVPKVGVGRPTKLLHSMQQNNVAVPLGRRQTQERKATEAQSKSLQENASAAKELRAQLASGGSKKDRVEATDDVKEENEDEDTSLSASEKRRKHERNAREAQSKHLQVAAKKVKLELENGDVATCTKEADADDNDDDDNQNSDENKSGKRKANKMTNAKETLVKHDAETSARLLKKKIKEMEQQKLNTYASNVEDKVRLHEHGWKDRYYTDKCKADDVAENGGKEHLFRSYVVGLCWVMKYYYDGCPSWKWYYPFHYAPFASDLRNIERFEKDCTSFQLGEPFKPVEQLMAVLPEDSSHAIPKASCWLMRDLESPIIDFYPTVTDIVCDPNGKAMPWLWVVLLPFIDEERLLAAMAPTMKNWTNEELLCNARGLDDGYVYCHVTHPLASAVTAALDAKDPKVTLRMEDITDVNRCTITGFVRRPLSNEVYPLDDKSVIDPPESAVVLDSHDNLYSTPIDPNAALCMAFTEPKKIPHKSALLDRARPPEPILTASDRRIRRPKLNRGGGTIANLGGNARDTRSHKPGYGSMNISTFERGLAEQNGRGHQMNQAGTRAWGAMEPSRKRPNNHPHPRIDQNNYNQHSYNQHNPTLFQQPIHNGGVHSHTRHGYGSTTHQGGRQQHDFRNYRSHQNNQTNLTWQPPKQQITSHNPPPRHFVSHNQYTQPPSRPPQQPYSFRGPQAIQPRIPSIRQAHPSTRTTSHIAPQKKAGINPSLMKSLKMQLASTLKKSSKGEQGNKK